MFQNHCLLLFVFLEGGVDPKSPLGTAAAFSKASKTALILANNSLLFEYASKELLKSFGKRLVIHN